MEISTVAEVGTAAGTLFLGVATFASVRSANRAARVAERSLLLGLRPVLTPSRPEDPDQEIVYGDGRRFVAASGTGVVEPVDDVLYLGIPLRNVGAGLAVLQRYYIFPESPSELMRHRHMAHDRLHREHGPLEEFRPQQRDLYIASGDTGYWQAAFRDPNDELHAQVRRAIAARDSISVELLYGDHEGGQRQISRFNLAPGDDAKWFCSVVFHWSLEGFDPRPV